MTHVNVTQEHIDRGIPKSKCSCPIALALQELGCQTIAVDTDQISYTENSEWVYWRTPAKTASFIFRFDNEMPVEPFSFELVSIL